MSDLGGGAVDCRTRGPNLLPRLVRLQSLATHAVLIWDGAWMVPDDNASAPRLADPEAQARVHALANRMAGELLGVDAVHADILDLAPASDPDFAEEPTVRELALIADGENPLRVSLRIALPSAARAALRCCREIRALPEPACSLSVRAGTLAGTTPTSDRPGPRHATGKGISGRAA